MFKTNFSENNKIWGDTKRILGKLPPNAPSCLGRNVARKSSNGAFVFAQGARYSENIFLIHNMPRIFRLCKLIISIFRQMLIIGS